MFLKCISFFCQVNNVGKNEEIEFEDVYFIIVQQSCSNLVCLGLKVEDICITKRFQFEKRACSYVCVKSGFIFPVITLIV